MDNPDDTSFLLCDEDPIFLMLSDDDDEDENITINNLLNPHPIFEYEKERIEYLFKQEIEFVSSNNNGSTTSPVHFNHTRFVAIHRNFKMSHELGFKLHTAYASVMYLDKFLSKQFIHKERPSAIPLLSVVCLSLAAKMREHELPVLSKYITDEDQGFINMQSIREMEVEVFSTLEWELTTVTPFDFLHHFACLLCPQSQPEPLVSEAVQHVVAILKDVNLMDQRPSIIALAAILMVAFGDTLTSEIMDLQIGEISLQRNLDKEKSKELGKLIASASTLTAQWSYTSVLDNSPVTSFTAQEKT